MSVNLYDKEVHNYCTLYLYSGDELINTISNRNLKVLELLGNRWVLRPVRRKLLTAVLYNRRYKREIARWRGEINVWD